MKLKGISTLFGKGDSQTTWVNRNIDTKKNIVDMTKGSDNDILLLGCGLFEPIEFSNLDTTRNIGRSFYTISKKNNF